MECERRVVYFANQGPEVRLQNLENENEQLRNEIESMAQLLEHQTKALNAIMLHLHANNALPQAVQSPALPVQAVSANWAPPEPVNIFGETRTLPPPATYLQTYPKRYLPDVPAPAQPSYETPVEPIVIVSPFAHGQERIRYNRTDGLYREKFDATSQTWNKTITIKTAEAVRKTGERRAREREAHLRQEQQKYVEALRKRPIRTGSVRAEVLRRRRSVQQLTGIPMVELRYSNPHKTAYHDATSARNKENIQQNNTPSIPVESSTSEAGNDFASTQTAQTAPAEGLSTPSRLDEGMRRVEAIISDSVSNAGIEWKSRMNVVNISRLKIAVKGAVGKYLQLNDASIFAELYVKFVSAFYRTKSMNMTEQQGLEYATTQLLQNKNDAQNYYRIRNKLVNAVLAEQA